MPLTRAKQAEFNDCILTANANRTAQYDERDGASHPEEINYNTRANTWSRSNRPTRTLGDHINICILLWSSHLDFLPAHSANPRQVRSRSWSSYVYDLIFSLLERPISRYSSCHKNHKSAQITIRSFLRRQLSVITRTVRSIVHKNSLHTLIDHILII